MSSTIRRTHVAALFWTTLAILACRTAPDSAARTVDPAMSADPHSHALPDEARVTHLALDLTADFERHVLRGTATLDLEVAPGAGAVVLDTTGLVVEAVRSAAGAPLAHGFGDADPVRGRALRIELPPDTRRVVIDYRTPPGAAALQWLAPEQTSGNRPFLFTQGQAILTRTWIPLQDTPSVRQTFEAQITVPADLVAVMSALPDGGPEEVPGGRRYRFRMPHPVPSYLIALAVGDLAFRSLGPRTGVYAEPPMVEAAAREFADTERMMEAAERLYGPYLWGRYDILVLPPSFPFGGMENPTLTFATPTIIAGDRSLVALVAHELAHSWSGNLVTNATWNDLWLNEGFTVYIENRIMEELYGEEYARMLRVLGWQDLAENLESMGRRADDTRLHQDLAGRNPDDAFSDVPYEKGALFLRMVERVTGRPAFDAFLREYFDRFRFRPMTAERLLGFLEDRLFADDPSGWRALAPESWVYEPGLPDNAVRPESDAFARVDLLRSRLLAGEPAPDAPFAAWSTHEWLHFLRGLPPVLPAERLAELDARFGLSSTGNSEILFEWLRVVIRNRYEPAFAALEDFLVRQGRRKFVKPLYQDLVKHDWGRDLARRIYDRARPTYHAVSSRSVDDVLRTAGA